MLHGDAGLGKKNSPAYLSTDSKDDVYQDSRAEASDKNLTRKLGVFQRGDEVFAGSAYKNRGDRISTPQGNTTYDKLVADGWKPVASLKLTVPQKNFAVTYSATEWAEMAETLRGMGQSTQRTYVAVDEALPGVVGPSAVQDGGDESTISDIPTGNEATEEEAAADAGTTDLPAREGTSGRGPAIPEVETEKVRVGKVTLEVAKLVSSAQVTEAEGAGIIFDEFGGGEISIDDAADMLTDLLEQNASAPRLAAINLLDRFERKYGSKDTAENINRAADAIQQASGDGIARSDFTSRLVQASQGTATGQGATADPDAGAARPDGGSRAEGTDAGEESGGEGEGAEGVTKFSGQSLVGLDFNRVNTLLPTVKPGAVLDVTGTPANIMQRAKDFFESLYGKRIMATDGKMIRIQNRRYSTVVSMLQHLIFQNAEASRALNVNKAASLPLIEQTLKTASIRMVDEESGNHIYVTRYGPTTYHFVIVEPSGEIASQGYSGGDLVTQFPHQRKPGEMGRERFRVVWDNATQLHQTALLAARIGSMGSGPRQHVFRDGNTSPDPTRQVSAARYAATVDHLRTAGYDVTFIEGKLPVGTAHSRSLCERGTVAAWRIKKPHRRLLCVTASRLTTWASWRRGCRS